MRTMKAKTDGREVTEMKRWDAADVRQVCINRNYYTCGDCAAYEKMLDFVRNNGYSLDGLYHVAKDIARHSDLTTYGHEEGSTCPEVIEAIMYELNAEAVITFYGVADTEERTTAAEYFG